MTTARQLNMKMRQALNKLDLFQATHDRWESTRKFAADRPYFVSAKYIYCIQIKNLATDKRMNEYFNGGIAF